MKYILLAALMAGLLTPVSGQPFTLAPLPYAYNALEPAIDARTMDIHYNRHHQAYVNNLNKAVAGTPLATVPLEVILMGASRRGDAVRNNGGGHYNHTLFWEILSPTAARWPTGALADAVHQTFGSLDSLKALLNQAAATRFGSGWAWLYVGIDGRLAVTSSPNQDNPIMDVMPQRGIPILGIDVWEHAYYLKYQNKRGDYLAGIWDVLDWKAVEAKYEAALKDPLLRRIARDTWTELKDFHAVMAQTFHPAEEGDLGPVKARAAELAAQATRLKASAIPPGLPADGVSRSLEKLAVEAEALHKIVRKHKKDEVIRQAIFSLHDRFHEVMEECDH